MRRAHTIQFTSNYKGHAVIGSSHDGGVMSFQCEILKETRKHHDGEAYEGIKSYDNVASLLDAIDRYDLSLRKEFTNTTAYRVGGGWRDEKHTVTEVKVTSVTEDGREAWISGPKQEYGSGREKVSITSLYSDKEACQRYCASMKFHIATYEKNIKRVKDELNQAKNLWKPQGE